MQVIIDRFEGEWAVVELPDGGTARLSNVLAAGAVEGDVLNIGVDADARSKRERAVEELMNDLFSD